MASTNCELPSLCNGQEVGWQSGVVDDNRAVGHSEFTVLHIACAQDGTCLTTAVRRYSIA